jgi:TonB-dependent receptor
MVASPPLDTSASEQIWGESQERAYFPDIAVLEWSQSSDERGAGFEASLGYGSTQDSTSAVDVHWDVVVFTRKGDEMRRMLAVLVVCCLTLAVSVAAAPPKQSTAGTERGGIQGRVADSSNNALAGATVRVEPSGFVDVTDREGRFTVSNLKAGTYTLEVTYVGFVTVSQELHVISGGPLKVDVRLTRAANVTENVTVTASRSYGEVQALNVRKTAENIVDVLPAEVILSLPNANVAEAVQRLPSISVERDEGEPKFIQVRGLESRFTSVTINGVRIPSTDRFGERQIKFDAFPSDLVGAIQLHKTISADQDGDAIGGSVNLVSKIAGDAPYFTVSAEGGYNSLQGGRHSSQVNATYTSRFGPDKALGLVLGGSYDYNGRAINDVESVPSVVSLPNGSSANAFTELDLRDYRYDRKRYGFAGGLDYRLGNNSSLYLKGFFAKFEDLGTVWGQNLIAGNFLTPTLTDNTGGFEASVQDRTAVEQTYSITAGGNHVLGTALLDYSVAYSNAANDSVNFTNVTFGGPSAAFAVDSSNEFYPKLTPLGGVTQFDPTQYDLSGVAFWSSREHTHATALAFNVAFPYASGELKVGGNYRDEDKKSDHFDRYYYPNGTATLKMSQALDSFTDPHFYYDHYEQGPNASMGGVLNFFNSNPNAFTENLNQEHLRNDPNNYDAKEKVAAIYAKDTNRFGQLVLELGVRVERTDDTFNAFLVTTDTEGNWASTTPTSGASKYTDVLPSISLKYELDRNTNLRAVYGQAIGRPNYGLLVPTLVLDVNRNLFNAGNPDLKPTKGQNYDLLFEHFLPSVGVVSVGAFYKDLKDPIYPGAESTIQGGIYDGYHLVKPINGPKAYIYGFEVAWQQRLGFLPGVLSGLGVDANYTHLDSKATFDPSTGRTGTAQLQRTTPNAANFGLTYDRHGFSARVAATYNSATIYYYNYSDGADGGLNGPNGDTYLYPHTQLDAQVSYTFHNGLQVFVNGLNLNNEVFGFYNGSENWMIQREFYDRTFSVGFRVSR